MAGPGYDTFADIGSMRNTLEIPPDFAAAAGHDPDEDDLDDDVMILGTTPSFGSTPRYPGANGGAAAAGNPSALLRQAQTVRVSAAARAAAAVSIPAHAESDDDDDDSSDDEMMGMSPDMADAPGFSAFMHQHRAGEVFAGRQR